MSRRMRSMLYIIIILSLTLISGCWDHRDVTEVSIITAMGIDKTPDGKIKITVEIPKPIELVNPTGGAGTGTEAKRSAVLYSSTGDTIFEAIRNTLNTINKKLLWAKLELLIIDENLAKDGIIKEIDLIERDPEVDVTALMLIAKGTTAEEVLSFESEVQKIPSIHIKRLIENNRKGLGTANEIRVVDFIRDLSRPGKKSTLIPTVQMDNTGERVTETNNIVVEGTAVLKEGRLVGTLTPYQTKGWLITDNKAGSSVFSISLPSNESKKIVFEMDRSKTKKKLVLKNGKVKMSLDIKVIGDIGESQESIDLTQREVIEQIKKKVEEAIKKEIESAISIAQELGADIFCFGEIYHRQYAVEWKKAETEWEDLFSQSPIDVTVEVKIERSGYILNSISPR